MYAPAELIDIFRDVIVPKAWLVTPNQFEAELLTNIQITDEPSAIKAMD